MLALLLCWGGVSTFRWFTAHQAELRARAIELAERTTHPLFYRDLIEQNAETFALDPALIAAITLCESSFDPTATSRVSARGLMQLMPDTAEWIADKVDTPNYSFDLLFDPATNLQYGSWYLGYLSKRFDGDAKKIVCAYHAGQGNVDAWLKNPKYSPDGVTLATIPTKDTNAYATRVLRALTIYQRYYFPPETVSASLPT